MAFVLIFLLCDNMTCEVLLKSAGYRRNLYLNLYLDGAQKSDEILTLTW